MDLNYPCLFVHFKRSGPSMQNRVQALMRVSAPHWLPSWFFSALALNPSTGTSLRLSLLCGILPQIIYLA